MSKFLELRKMKHPTPFTPFTAHGARSRVSREMGTLGKLLPVITEAAQTAMQDLGDKCLNFWNYAK